MDYKYTGIILNKREVGETDRIYTIYTQETGKIKAIGKGVRKPNAKLAGSLEPITLSEVFVAKSRGLGKITGAIVSENFLALKNNFDALNKVNQIFRIFERIISEQEQDKEIFEILLSFVRGLDKLSGVDNAENKMDILVMGFTFKLLSATGYRLEVEKCVNCEKKLQPDQNYFSAGKGGVLCQNCHQLESKRIKISSGSIKLIRIFLKNKIDNLVKLQVSPRDVNNLKIIAQEAINWL